MQQTELEITNYAHLTQWLLLNQLLGVMGAHILSIMNQEMTDHNSFICVYRRLPMLMYLRKKRTNLHMRLTLVLEQL